MAVKSQRAGTAAVGYDIAAVAAAARARVEFVVERAIAIAQVPAPTDQEARRSDFVAALMAEHLGWTHSVDELGDVVGRIDGIADGAPVLLAAHLDTVFPADTRIVACRTNGRVHAPGIGDNALGVSAVLAVPEILEDLGMTAAGPLLVTGNVGEEGLGNLKGMRRVLDGHPGVGAVVAVEGHNLGRVTHVAVGSRRLRVRVSGPGGHSWGDFGNPNAIQAAADIIHELGRITLPTNPKTTLSIGTINGGISVNTIAPDASFDVDLRSIEDFALRRLVDRVGRVLSANRNRITVESEVIGDRPAGFVSPESAIVKIAVDVLEQLGVHPVGDASSTDANVPIGRGIPAICVGLTTGGNVHREDEYIDIEPIANGLTQLVALSLEISEALSEDRLRGS